MSLVGWQSLSSLIRIYRDAARQAKLIGPGALHEYAELDLRFRAGALAIAASKAAGEVPEIDVVNICALALSLEPLVAHTLRPEVLSLVDETDLHSVPSEPPRLLRRAWIVEVAHPERGERLLDNYACLGGYQFENRICIIGLGYPDGLRIGWWAPKWSGEEIAAGVVAETGILVPDVETHEAWIRDAARFAVVCGLLLDAAGSPVRVTDESDRPKTSPARSKKQKPPPAWVTRYVSLSPAPWAAPAGAEPGSSTTTIEGREAVESRVRGHLKRQHHGPGGKEVRWIWVESYEARRWIAPAPRRVVVSQ